MKRILRVLCLIILCHTFVVINPAFAQAPASTTIFFCSDRDGDHEIYSMNAGGGNLVQLTFNTSDEAEVMCSPDGRRLLFASDRDGNYEVYLMNVDGTGLVRLTDNPAADLGPSWSRDGSKIVFESDRDGDREIYVMNPDSSGLEQLTFNDREDSFPDWSPDGSRITFHSDRGSYTDIWVMNADGTNPQNLTNNPAGEYMPEWSPDGEYIVFESRRVGGLELFVMDADGGNVRRLTYIYTDCHEADWSPDGSKILFVAQYGGNYEVMSINTDGTQLQNLTNSGYTDWGPTWQPVPLEAADIGGGTGILTFTYQPLSAPDYHKIHTIRLDGTENQKISDATFGLNHQEWSPNGRQLAAVGYVNSATWSIFTLNADGSNLTRLTTMYGVWDNEPSWSPDGTELVWGRTYPAQGYRKEIWRMYADGNFQRFIGVYGDEVRWSPGGTRLLYFRQAANYHLFTCDLDGGNEQQLTIGAYDNMSSAWSPDGSAIVFSSNRDGNWEIYVMNADGTGQRRLSNSAQDNWSPAWSPDGTLIAFDAALTPGMMDWEVFVMDSSGMTLRRVTFSPPTITGINPDWQPIDSTLVPVFLAGFHCEQKNGRVTIGWSVSEAAAAKDFRVEAEANGKRRNLVVNAEGPRRFAAVDPGPGADREEPVTYRLYARHENNKWNLLRSKTLELRTQIPTSRITGVYPNPFNPHTTVSFSIASPQVVSLDIHDAEGRKVIALVNREYPTGEFQVQWNGRDGAGREVASGIYFMRFKAGKRTESRKLVLVR